MLKVLDTVGSELDRGALSGLKILCHAPDCISILREMRFSLFWVPQHMKDAGQLSSAGRGLWRCNPQEAQGEAETGIFTYVEKRIPT